MARNPVNDITYYLSESDYPSLDITLSGTLRIVSLTDNVIDLDIQLEGALVKQEVISGYIGDLGIELSGDFYTQGLKSNWIKWSKIGQFDFIIDKSNLAGETPLDWSGNVYRLGQLDKNIVAYGSGGVSVLSPADNAFGKKTILRQAVMSKGAVLITDTFHLFITSDGCLWRLDTQLHKLGYEEYLDLLSNPVISYDILNDLAYICDGTIGYVYNCKDQSLGQGPINVTGIGYYLDNPYFLASSTSLAAQTFELTFDTMDFMNRSFKTIREVEIGIDSDQSFQLGISFKVGMGTTFTGPIWFNVTPEGRVFPNCWGKDFKIHLKTATTDSFKISYINIKGQFADYNPIDA